MLRFTLILLSALAPIGSQAQQSQSADQPEAAVASIEEPTPGMSLSFWANFSDFAVREFFMQNEDGVYQLDRALLSFVNNIPTDPNDEGAFSPFALAQQPIYETVAESVMLWEWKGFLELAESGPAFLSFEASFRECAVEYSLNHEVLLPFDDIPNNRRTSFQTTVALGSVTAGEVVELQITVLCSQRRIERYDDETFSFEMLYPQSGIRITAAEYHHM